jgi:hypothetical protein
MLKLVAGTKGEASLKFIGFSTILTIKPVMVTVSTPAIKTIRSPLICLLLSRGDVIITMGKNKVGNLCCIDAKEDSVSSDQITPIRHKRKIPIKAKAGFWDTKTLYFSRKLPSTSQFRVTITRLNVSRNRVVDSAKANEHNPI